MKLVTNDYGCGTSASILDYGIKDVIVVSEDNWEHIFDANDDLMFIGHDFLMYIWDTDEKVNRLKEYPHAKLVWCFERIDAIVPSWQKKSHYSISKIQKFADEIIGCDEDDCDKYNLRWLPQWASPLFFEKRNIKPLENNNILFSGQAGKPEYQARNELLYECQQDEKLSTRIKITNIDRSLTWESYVENFLRNSKVINPVGVLKALNTRAYEGLYSGRIVFQHQIGEYRRHQVLLSNNKNIIFFNDFNDLVEKVEESDQIIYPVDNDVINAYKSNNIFARMKSLGIEIK